MQGTVVAETVTLQATGTDALFGSLSVGFFLTQPSAGPTNTERLLVMHIHSAVNLPAGDGLPSSFTAAKTTREIQARTPMRACTSTARETRHPLWNTKYVSCRVSCVLLICVCCCLFVSE